MLFYASKQQLQHYWRYLHTPITATCTTKMGAERITLTHMSEVHSAA